MRVLAVVPARGGSKGVPGKNLRTVGGRPLLAWTLGLWAAFGTWALLSEHTFAWSRERFLRGWLLGLGLGAAFLLIAWLRTRPAMKPWIKVSLSALTVAAFARALVEFVERYG